MNLETTVKSRQVGYSLALENEAMRRTLSEIRKILQGPASNMRFMQIANPARQCINLIKPFLKGNTEP